MPVRRARARASEPTSPVGDCRLDRRGFLAAALAFGLGFQRRAFAASEPGALPPEAREALAGSRFVYVSPLRPDGAESTCHGEVWYAWLDGSVALVTSTSSWKARSVARGQDRARIWVGDHGRWKGTFGTREEFRKAPSFVARARTSKDADLLERMLGVYDRKYPDEIGRWRDRFREGLASGERLILLYDPV